MLHYCLLSYRYVLDITFVNHTLKQMETQVGRRKKRTRLSKCMPV